MSAVPEAEWVSGVYEGFSARFNENFSSTSLDDAIKKILNFAYLGPLISLSSSPSTAVREKGASVASVTLTADTTKRSEDITEVRFYRAGVLVNTDASASPDGSANSAYTDNTAFTDTMTFFAQVDDGVGATVQSGTITYSYAYPYYYGVGAAGLTGAQIAALTKDVRASSSSVAVTASATAQRYYFAYPSAYPVLTSILDPNGFQIISSYTVRTVNITGLDGTSQSYRVYEMTNPTTQTAYTITYIR